MPRLIIVAITLSLVLTVPAHAQTLEQASKLVDFLDRTGSELAQSNTNLLQMTEGMQSPESERAMMIFDSVTNTECYFGELLTVATIYSLMVDNRDRATVKKMLGLLAKQSVKAANVTISTSNRELAKMRSPSAVAEAQKARDLVQKIRDEIQRTFPGS